MTDATLMLRRALFAVQSAATPIPPGTPRAGEHMLDTGANDVLAHLLPLLRAQGLHWRCLGAKAEVSACAAGDIRTVLVQHELEHFESGQRETYKHEIHYDGKLGGVGTTKAAAAQALELLVGVPRQPSASTHVTSPDDFEEPRTTERRVVLEPVAEVAEAQLSEAQRTTAIASLRAALVDAGDTRTNEQLRAAARVPVRGAMAPADQEAYRLFLGAEVRKLEGAEA